MLVEREALGRDGRSGEIAGEPLGDEYKTGAAELYPTKKKARRSSKAKPRAKRK